MEITMSESLTVIPATLIEQLKENPKIRMIDVRSPIEYESVHIPGTYNIPIDMLSEHRDKLVDHVRGPVVFVCQSGARATEAFNKASSDPDMQKLIDQGLTHIHILEGGINAWESIGGEVKRGAQRWSIERQIRCIVGSVVFISIMVSIFIPWTKWIAAIVGAGLTFAAVTQFCMMEKMLLLLPHNRPSRSNVESIVCKLIEDCKD
jgi:rhodanese-related sulfurtransferase